MACFANNGYLPYKFDLQCIKWDVQPVIGSLLADLCGLVCPYMEVARKVLKIKHRSTLQLRVGHSFTAYSGSYAPGNIYTVEELFYVPHILAQRPSKASISLIK